MTSRCAAVTTAAALLLCAAPATASGRLGGGEALDVSLGRIMLALIVCIIITILAVLVIRQRGGRTDLRAMFARFELKPRAVDVVETRRLSPNADICVIRHGGREYLLLLVAGAARVLSETPVVQEAASETAVR